MPKHLSVLLSVGEAKRIAGSLGEPSKMPGYSYGLSAFQCERGGELVKVPGSTCFNCYARKNFYATWKPALIARRRRHEGILHPRWVDAMTTLILHYCKPPEHYFRWHDSGDLSDVLATSETSRTSHERLQGRVEHLRRICEVARRTPGVHHWLPTKEYRAVEAYLAAGGVIPDNLAVRLSAEMIDTEPVVPTTLAHLPTATVHTAVPVILEGKGFIDCKAIEKRGNICGPCRACWSPDVKNVSYPEH